MKGRRKVVNGRSVFDKIKKTGVDEFLKVKNGSQYLTKLRSPMLTFFPIITKIGSTSYLHIII